MTDQASAVRGIAETLAPLFEEHGIHTMAVVASREPSEMRIWEYFGYGYPDAGDYVALSLVELRLHKKINPLLEATCESVETAWHRVLIELEYPSGRTKLTFEYDDPERWSWDMHDSSALGESLRPQFDEPANG